MWLVILAGWLAAGIALGVYVSVRQRRHPPSVGPARAKLGNPDPDNRDCPWSF